MGDIQENDEFAEHEKEAQVQEDKEKLLEELVSLTLVTTC